jgi:hypothetical protein
LTPPDAAGAEITQLYRLVAYGLALVNQPGVFALNHCRGKYQQVCKDRKNSEKAILVTPIEYQIRIILWMLPNFLSQIEKPQVGLGFL